MGMAGRAAGSLAGRRWLKGDLHPGWVSVPQSRQLLVHTGASSLPLSIGRTKVLVSD